VNGGKWLVNPGGAKHQKPPNNPTSSRSDPKKFCGKFNRSRRNAFLKGGFLGDSAERSNLVQPGRYEGVVLTTVYGGVTNHRTSELTTLISWVSPETSVGKVCFFLLTSFFPNSYVGDPQKPREKKKRNDFCRREVKRRLGTGACWKDPVMGSHPKKK